MTRREHQNYDSTYDRDTDRITRGRQTTIASREQYKMTVTGGNKEHGPAEGTAMVHKQDGSDAGVNMRRDDGGDRHACVMYTVMV